MLNMTFWCVEGANKALQQNRGDVVRYGESVGCDLLKAAVSPEETMMIVTYFSADDPELASTFVGWLTVAAQPVSREVANPFTGESQRIEEWPPQSPIRDGVPAECPDLAQLPQAELRRVEHTKLASLFNLMLGLPGDKALHAILKPALIHPTNEDVGLHAVPAELAKELASLDDGHIDSTAKQWQQTEEMQADNFSVSDCKTVLQLLRDVAQSGKSSRTMYFLWSL